MFISALLFKVVDDDVVMRKAEIEKQLEFCVQALHMRLVQSRLFIPGFFRGLCRTSRQKLSRPSPASSSNDSRLSAVFCLGPRPRLLKVIPSYRSFIRSLLLTKLHVFTLRTSNVLISCSSLRTTLASAIAVVLVLKSQHLTLTSSRMMVYASHRSMSLLLVHPRGQCSCQGQTITSQAWVS